ncbi:MAG: sulfotransferase [Candidatus Limnocylindrales bacterium]
MPRTDPPVFVVGVARSGTTLLSAMLSAHPRLDCGPESRFFARYRHLDERARQRVLDPATWPRPAVDFIGSLRNQGHPITELFGLTLPEIGTYLAGRRPSATAMLESLTVLHAQRRGKARWVEKTPRHLLMTETLREGWPEAFIVRIVRDPRDVALSLAGMPFAKESVVGNLVRIDEDDRASRVRIERDPRAMTLRYEDLVTEPERELRRVCTFIGEDYEAAMLDSRKTAAGVAAEHEWWKASVSGPLDTANIGKWREQMSADARRFADLHLASYLREHGYEGAVEPRRSVAVVPVGAAVGPSNERLLLDLARRGIVVERPAPTGVNALRRAHAEGRLLCLGTKGQLDPSRGQGVRARTFTVLAAVIGLPLRRLQGRPVLWLRRHTLRQKRPTDPVERIVSPLFRLLAREVSIEEAADLVDARG